MPDTHLQKGKGGGEIIEQIKKRNLGRKDGWMEGWDG